MTNALDISHFTELTSGPLTAEALERCAERQVKKFAVSIADQNIARRQIEALVQSPWQFEIETYRYYYYSSMRFTREDDARFIDEIRRNAYNLQFHWLDHEDTSVRQPVEANVYDINDMVNFWAGKCRTGIYTAKWWWEDYMQNYDGFSYMPLWFAQWDWAETLELAVPFGGWTRGAMKQTMGDVYLDGLVWCDTNYYEATAEQPKIVVPQAQWDSLRALLEGAKITIDTARELAAQIGT